MRESPHKARRADEIGRYDDVQRAIRDHASGAALRALYETAVATAVEASCARDAMSKYIADAIAAGLEPARRERSTGLANAAAAKLQGKRDGIVHALAVVLDIDESDIDAATRLDATDA